MIPFESTEGTYRNSGFHHFRVGTCHGLWRSTPTSYDILGVINQEKGNGHFKETMRWFEQSCRRDGKKLRILQVLNPILAYKCYKHGYRWRPLLTWEKDFSTPIT